MNQSFLCRGLAVVMAMTLSACSVAPTFAVELDEADSSVVMLDDAPAQEVVEATETTEPVEESDLEQTDTTQEIVVEETEAEEATQAETKAQTPDSHSNLQVASYTTEAVVTVEDTEETEDSDVSTQSAEPVTEQESVTNSTVSATSSSPILTLDKKQSVNGCEPTREAVKAKQGEIVTYFLTVTNSEDSTSSTNAISIVDNIPSGMTYVEGSASGHPTISNEKISWEIADLAAGQSVVVSYQAQIPDDATADTTYKGTANASCYVESLTESPKTGDEHHPTAWLTTACLSCVGMLAGAFELLRLKRHG